MTEYVWWPEDVFGSRKDADQLLDSIEVGKRVLIWKNFQQESPALFFDEDGWVRSGWI
jgi:hypothetical protein